MAINRIRKFSEIFEAQVFLNGGLVLVPPGFGNGISGLVGKTLKFTSPAVVTVTFVTSNAAGGSAEPGVGTNPDKNVLFFKDLKLQIEAAIAAVKVTSQNGKLVLQEVTPASGVVLDNTGTAATLLGTDKVGSTTGKVYAPPPSAVVPCWTWASTGNDNAITIFTLE